MAQRRANAGRTADNSFTNISPHKVCSDRPCLRLEEMIASCKSARSTPRRLACERGATVPNLPKPLADLRVVTCEALMALPFSTQILSDLGAQISAVEHVDWRDDSETSAWRLRTGRRKRRIAVDLRLPEGQEIVRTLASRADLFGVN